MFLEKFPYRVKFYTKEIRITLCHKAAVRRQDFCIGIIGVVGSLGVIGAVGRKFLGGPYTIIPVQYFSSMHSMERFFMTARGLVLIIVFRIHDFFLI